MFAKFGAYLDLFRKGSEVSNPEKWKSRQITGTMVAGLLIALLNVAKAYGYDIPLNMDDVNNLGLGIVALVNVVLTATTSTRAGLLPAKPTDGSGVGQVSGDVPTEADAGTPDQWSINKLSTGDQAQPPKGSQPAADDSGDIYIG